MSDIELKIRRTPKLVITDENGNNLFETTILHINSLVILSRSGLGNDDPNHVEVADSRLAESLNSEFGTDLTPEDAYQIRLRALDILGELRRGFTSGPK